MCLIITLCAIAYFIAASITYGILEYMDLEYDEYSGEVKEKRKDEESCPNSVISIFWPIVLVFVLICGPFDFASWMAKKIKQMQNPKKMNFNTNNYE